MKKLAPYQIFFPLGLLNAFLGVGIWLAQDWRWFEVPPIFIHAKLIAGGFLWSFITGFLMTAIPRMTGTSGANKWEYFFSVLSGFLLFVFSWIIDPRPFYATHFFLVLFLVIYGGRRLLKLNKPVPLFFSHIGIGVILSLCGLVFYFQGNSFMGIHLYHLGSVLLLILGIGTRFFSFLSGLSSSFEETKEKWKRLVFHVNGILVGVLLFIAGSGYTEAYLALSLLSLVYLFFIWQVQRSSSRPSALKWAARIVAATLPVGFFFTWYQPFMFITWFHLIFVGCFGILTLSVATRVILAHGAYPIDWEVKLKSLWWFLGFLLLSLVARLFYGFSQDLWWKKSWLSSAVTFWICALMIWCWTLLLKIFKAGPQSKPSCS